LFAHDDRCQARRPCARRYDLDRRQPAADTRLLRFVGELLFGERWQTPLAACLGSIRGRALSPATVHQWSTRTRSIPPWVKDALVIALERAQTDMRQRAETAQSVARRIRRAES
jgi:hypothetical protein